MTAMALARDLALRWAPLGSTAADLSSRWYVMIGVSLQWDEAECSIRGRPVPAWPLRTLRGACADPGGGKPLSPVSGLGRGRRL